MTELFFHPDIDFVLSEYRDTPILYHDGYHYFRRFRSHGLIRSLGLYTYHVRHADDGEWMIPCSIENKHVSVNYCGFIISPVELFVEYIEFVETIEIKLENGTKYIDEYLTLTKEEGYQIADPLDEEGEPTGYVDFLEVYEKWRKEYGIEFKG